VCVVWSGMLRMLCRRRTVTRTEFGVGDDGQRGVEPKFTSSGGESACVVHTTMARGRSHNRRSSSHRPGVPRRDDGRFAQVTTRVIW